MSEAQGMDAEAVKQAITAGYGAHAYQEYEAIVASHRPDPEHPVWTWGPAAEAQFEEVYAQFLAWQDVFAREVLAAVQVHRGLALSAQDLCVVLRRIETHARDQVRIDDAWEHDTGRRADEDMQEHIIRTEGMSEGDFATLIGYEFQQDGFHRGRVYLKTADALERYMREVVAPAFREGREMMITDSGDHAVFHIKDAVVWHAGGADTRAMATLLTQLGDAPTWREGWKARHGIEIPRHRPHRTTEPPEQEQRHGQRYGR